jgi:hypothetical protein
MYSKLSGATPEGKMAKCLMTIRFLKRDDNGNKYYYIIPYNCLFSVIRSNLVKRNTLIIYYSPPFYGMFCSTNLSYAKWQMKQCSDVKT